MPNPLGPNQFHNIVRFRMRIDADGVPFLGGAEVVPCTFQPKTDDAPAKELFDGVAEPVDLTGEEEGHPLKEILTALDAAAIAANGKYQAALDEAKALKEKAVAEADKAKADQKAVEDAHALQAKEVAKQAATIKDYTKRIGDLGTVNTKHEEAAGLSGEHIKKLKFIVSEDAAKITRLNAEAHASATRITDYAAKVAALQVRVREQNEELERRPAAP